MTRRPAMAIGAAVGVSFLAACGGPPAVTAPTRVQSTAPAGGDGPAPPTAQPSAILSVSTFEMQFAELFSGSYWYRPAMVLTETGGTSAAKLRSIAFSLSDGSRFDIVDDAPPGTGCFLTPESTHVPAGGTWNIDSVYAYCLDIDSRVDLRGQQVGVEIRFTDEAGQPGVVTEHITVR